MNLKIAPKAVGAFPEPVAPENAPLVLSVREREIMDLLAQGLSNKEIGARLSLSQFTIRNHLAKVFGKLHVHNRTGAAMAYLRGPK